MERTTDSTGDAGSVPPQKATATQHRSGHERSFNHFAGIPHGGRTDRRVIDGQETWESRLSLSNHPPRAKPLAEALRRHWSIENSQHRVLDVAFGEDARRQQDRNGGANLGAVRHLSVSLLHQEKTINRGAKCKRMACALDPNDLLKVFHNAIIDA